MRWDRRIRKLRTNSSESRCVHKHISSSCLFCLDIYIYVVCECEWVCSACTHIILSVTNSRQFLHIFCRFFFRCCCCYSLANCQRSPLLCGRKLTSTNWLFYLHTNMLACNCRSRYIYICSVVSSHIGKTTATNGISATARSLVHPYIHTLQIAHLSFLLSFLSYLSTYNLVFMMLSSAWLTWGRRCELLYVIVIIENKLIINMLYALLLCCSSAASLLDGRIAMTNIVLVCVCGHDAMRYSCEIQFHFIDELDNRMQFPLCITFQFLFDMCVRFRHPAVGKVDTIFYQLLLFVIR